MRELTINLVGLELEIALSDLAMQKNVFGYDDISESVAKCFGATVSEITAKKSHPDFHNFIQARNVVVSKLWGW